MLEKKESILGSKLAVSVMYWNGKSFINVNFPQAQRGKRGLLAK